MSLSKLCPADSCTFTIGVVQLWKPSKNPLFLVPYRPSCVCEERGTCKGFRGGRTKRMAFRRRSRLVHIIALYTNWIPADRQTGGEGGRRQLKLKFHTVCTAISAAVYPSVRRRAPSYVRAYTIHIRASIRECVCLVLRRHSGLGRRTQYLTITSFVPGPQTDKTYVVFQ